jgi:stalled ribosome rescue protein Dom34
MAAKAGVWIDHKQAFVVLLTDAGQEIKTVQSGIEAPGKSAGSNSTSKYTPNDFVAEDRLERKVVSHRKKYFDDVAACIRGAEAVLILGPGEAKGEFSKHIQGKKIRGVVEVETTDKMTARQLAAKVTQHFATSSAKKSVAPKAPAKKMVKATAGKRPQKKGK